MHNASGPAITAIFICIMYGLKGLIEKEGETGFGVFMGLGPQREFEASFIIYC